MHRAVMAVVLGVIAFASVTSLVGFLLARRRPSSSFAASPLDIRQTPRRKYCANVTIVGAEIETELEKLRECHVIEGHLWLQSCQLPKLASLPFLTQVRDYVILDDVRGLDELATFLPCLSVIRGERLFSGYAFVLRANSDLQEIGPWSLSTIRRGAVYVKDNILFCYNENIWRNLTRTMSNFQLSVFHNNHNFCPFVKCEEKGYCPPPSKTCLSTGQPPIIEKVCHKECLGGCTTPRDPSSCVACKHFLLDRMRNGYGECVEKCPHKTLQFLNYLCISYETCEQNHWVVFNEYQLQTSPIGKRALEESAVGDREKAVEECRKECPEMFVNLKDGSGRTHRCVPRLVCETTTLTSRNVGDNLRHCSHINGSLSIQVTGGKDVARRLETNLRQIETVRDYVMVVGANTLFSLSFLVNLREIQGQNVYAVNSHEGYAFYVLENPNLRELWDWGTRSRNLTINGSAFIYMNDRLCPIEVEKLKKITKLPSSNVISEFNGRKNQCRVFKTILMAQPGSRIQLSWKHTYCGADPRYVIGYNIYYIKAEEGKVSLYQGRDTCNDNSLWKRKLMKVPDLPADPICLNYTLEGLELNTQYAIYVISFAADDIKNSIQSNIVYSNTYVNPRRPQKEEVKFSDGGFRISWLNTSGPDGASPSLAKRLFYEINVRIEGAHRDQKEVSETSVDIRTSLDIRSKDDMIAEERFDITKDSCNCEDTEESIAFLKENRRQTIDTVHEISRVFLNPENQKLDVNISEYFPNGIQLPNISITRMYDKTDRSCRQAGALPGECLQPFLDWSNASFQFTSLSRPSPWQSKENLYQFKNRTSNQNIFIPWPDVFKERLKPVRIYVEVRSCIQEFLDSCPQPNVSAPCALCSRYTRWTEYDVRNKNVSKFEIQTLRRSEKEDGQRQDAIYIECKRAVVGQDPRNILPFVTPQDQINNLSIIVSWEVPKDLEPIIRGYDIFYQKVNNPQVYPFSTFVPPAQVENGTKELRLPLPSSGEYWTGIQIRTLAGNGTMAQKCIRVPGTENTILWPILLACMILSMLLVASLSLILVWMKKPEPPPKTENKAYGDVIQGFSDFIKEDFIIAPGNLKVNFGAPLGEGRFGVVFKGSIEFGTVKVAVKTTKSSSNEDSVAKSIYYLLLEGNAAQEMDSCFVVKLMGATQGYLPEHPELDRSIYLAYEYMEGGNLKDFLLYKKANEEEVNEKGMAEICAEVADGLAYISSMGFIHNDVAASNVMLRSQNGRMVAKIGDFGLTARLDEDGRYAPSEREIFPVRRCALEFLVDGTYIPKSDVWSFGVMIYEIITRGDDPYKGLTPREVKKKVSNGSLRLADAIPQESSPFLASVLQRCTATNPKERPGFIELVKEFLSKTDQDFVDWFQSQPVFSLSVLSTSESTEGCDEGYGPGSSLDADHESNDLGNLTDMDDDSRVCITPRGCRKEHSCCLSYIDRSL